MFLYILKLREIDLIKIGIASSDNRIVSHLRTYRDYGIDLTESYRITANDNSYIKMLEKQLLADYSEYSSSNKDLYQRDGYTELRDGSLIKNILEDIEHKKERFPAKEIEISKGIKIKTRRRKKTRSNPNEEERIKYMDFLKEYNRNLIDINVGKDTVRLTFDNLTDLQLRDVGNRHHLILSNISKERHSFLNCTLSYQSPYTNPTNKISLIIALHPEKNFHDIQAFRANLMDFINLNQDLISCA